MRDCKRVCIKGSGGWGQVQLWCTPYPQHLGQQHPLSLPPPQPASQGAASCALRLIVLLGPTAAALQQDPFVISSSSEGAIQSCALTTSPPCKWLALQPHSLLNLRGTSSSFAETPGCFCCMWSSSACREAAQGGGRYTRPASARGGGCYIRTALQKP